MQINETISFEEGIELNLQNQEFQDWFNVNIMPNITFADGKNGTVQTCATFDEFSRPETWVFGNMMVRAVYFTQNENYNFNKFVCYGII